MLNVKYAEEAKVALQANSLFVVGGAPPSNEPFSKKVVDWLVNKNIETIPVVRMAVNFFGLLYLRDTVGRRPNPAEVWDPTWGKTVYVYADPAQSAWYSDLVKVADANLRFLDHFMLTYLCAATAGELRHAGSKSTVKADEILAKWRIRIGGKVHDRTVTQRNFLLHAQPEQIPAYLKDAVNIFGGGGWSSSFGGKKWADIARTGLDRVTGVYDPTIFVDRVFDLKHNGGPMFDKNSVINQQTLPEFLNAKLLLKTDGGWRKWLPYGTRELMDLVDRARILNLWQDTGPLVVNNLPQSLEPVGYTPLKEVPKFNHTVQEMPEPTHEGPNFDPGPVECPNGKKHAP